MLVTRSWKYCTISENMKLKALKLTCHDNNDGNDNNNKNPTQNKRTTKTVE